MGGWVGVVGGWVTHLGSSSCLPAPARHEGTGIVRITLRTTTCESRSWKAEAGMARNLIHVCSWSCSMTHAPSCLIMNLRSQKLQPGSCTPRRQTLAWAGALKVRHEGNTACLRGWLESTPRRQTASWSPSWHPQLEPAQPRGPGCCRSTCPETAWCPRRKRVANSRQIRPRPVADCVLGTKTA